MNVRVDMDGLICDLFSAVSLKLFNKPYNQITPEEKTEAKKIWYDKEHFVDNFGDVENFFTSLPPFGKNGELTNAIIDTVVKISGGYSICSHPAGIDAAACRRGKITWIKNNLNPQPTEMLFPQSKAVYAMTNGTPNVLIDDFPPYVKAWRDAGGIAIEMRTDSFHSVDQVKGFLTNELNKAKIEIDGIKSESAFDTLYKKLTLAFN